MDIFSQHSVDIIKNGIILDQEDIATLEDTNMDAKYNCAPYYDCKGFSVLHKLVLLTNKYSKLNIVIKDYIASYPEELNKVNEYGWSALHLASRNSNTWSNIETVKLILSCVKNNAGINAKSKLGSTALMLALENSNNSSSLEIVNLLLKNNADVNAKNGRGHTALIYVRKCSNITVKLLLEYDADTREYIGLYDENKMKLINEIKLLNIKQ